MFGELISGIFNWSGGKKAREADLHQFDVANQFTRELQEDAQQFNAEQAELARIFNSGESAISRDWNAAQAALGREFNAEEALKARQFNAQEAGIGRTFSAEQARLQHERNSLEAQKNRDFQERMSNTQYQRAIGDMMQAGLNPMLAYSQGGAGNVGGSTASSQAASAPVASGPAASGGSASGSAASGPSASSGAGSSVSPPRSANILGAAASSAISAAQALAGVEQANASTDYTKAQTAAVATQVELMKSQAGLTTAQRAEVEQKVAEMLYGWNHGFTQRNISNQSHIKSRETNIIDEKWRQELEKTKQEGMHTSYLALERPMRVGEAQLHETLNREVVGGGTSAKAISDVFTNAFRALLQRPYYGR